MNRIMTLSLLAVGVVSGTLLWMRVSPGLRSHLSTGNLTTHTEDSPVPTIERECGAISMYFAALRCGVPIQYRELKSQLPPGPNGVSFNQIAEIAKRHGFKTVLHRVSFEELRSSQAVAILWVDTNHFVVADSRESDPDRPGQIRIYDAYGPTEWYSEKKLAKRWTGETLFLYPSYENEQAGPYARFDEMMIDAGWVDSTEMTEFVFRFQNTGDSPLDLRIQGASCGCASAEGGVNDLPPGEWGEVKAKLDLIGKRGPVRSFILVATNDPNNPHFKLSIAASVFRSFNITHRHIDLGEISRGQEKSLVSYILDRGDRTLRVQGASVNIQGWSTDSLPSVIWKKVGPDLLVNQPEMGHSVKSGDFLVQAVFTPGSNTPLGDFKGTLKVNTNQNRPGQDTYLTFAGEILSSMSLSPSVVALSNDMPYAVVTATNRYEGSAVKLDSFRIIPSDMPISLHETRHPLTSSASYTIRLVEGYVITKARRGEVELVFADGTRARLMVHLLAAGSKNSDGTEE